MDQGTQAYRVRLNVAEHMLRDFRPNVPGEMLRRAQVQNPAKVEGESNAIFGEWWVDVWPVDGMDPSYLGTQCILMYVKRLWTT